MGKIAYPTSLAPRGNIVDKYQGLKGEILVADPYRFFEDPESKQTKEWVAAENDLTSKFLASCPIQEEYAKKLKKLTTLTSVSVVKQHGNHYYFLHTSPEQE